VLYETLSGVAATLILPSIRDAVWGIYFRYRAWQGSPSYAPGVRYARLINGKGCGNYGACRLEACGWLRVDLCFPDGRMPLANRNLSNSMGCWPMLIASRRISGQCPGCRFTILDELKEIKMALTGTDPIKFLLAILLPPVGVFVEVGLTAHFWLNILLTILGFIPGIIHALWVILRY